MLEKHFDRDHFMCHDAQCLAARFVVFENEIDLRAHEQGVHGQRGGMGGRRLSWSSYFQFGLNGEAFVPEALPGTELQRLQQEQQQRQENEPEITNAAHAARTAELRALAANIRERDGISGVGRRWWYRSVSCFGCRLAAAASGMLVGWSGDGARTAAGSRLKKTPAGKY
ncbi:hypothetical protein QTG54_008367 [Skeletonema marinoi]|uniref:ZNF598/HEL2 C2H2 zinc finger domain-containing protein n=1 Tax=Skeletonema marinoi TaxID=267567 RepID=A0AAD8Y8R9_9STRA|nr:hypothetical protein QTG54_008367 [Skeletonema marinoi]